MTNKFILTELNKRKAHLEVEIEQLEQRKKYISHADKRALNKQKAINKKITNRLESIDKNHSRKLSYYKELLEKYDLESEQSPQTEIEQENTEPYSETYDIFEFEKVKEGTEIHHLQGINNFNEEPRLNLIREHKELFIDD